MKQTTNFENQKLDQNLNPITPPKNIFKILFFILLALVLVIISVLITLLITKTKTPVSNQITPVPTSTIVDETVNWKTYTDDIAGFTFKYPSTIVFEIDPIKVRNGIPQSIFLISIDKISSLSDNSYGGGPELVQNNKNILEKGDSFITSDLKPSIKVVKLDNKINAQMSMTLTRQEDCDLSLIREITFFKGDFRIQIEYRYNDRNLASKIPSKYLTFNKEKCGDESIWKNQEEFYKDISNNQLENKVLQNWFNDFDQIIKTIKIQ